MALVERNLQRLRTDYVDVYLVHWSETRRCSPSTTAGGGQGALYRSVNLRLAHIEPCMQLRPIGAAQYGWNMLRFEILRFCAAQQIGVMAY
jgi:aryl-alcohol dehydrogenase-like predicted oxidoreductase